MITEKMLEQARQIFAAKAAEFANRVQPYYHVMNWKWSPDDPSGDEFIPSVDDIVVLINQLADKLKPSEDATTVDISTGGIELSVTAYPKLNNHIVARIAFIPVSVRG